MRPGRADVVISSDPGTSLIAQAEQDGMWAVAVLLLLDTNESRERRSAENCRYVREQMRERQPQIAAAIDEAVRDA